MQALIRLGNRLLDIARFFAWLPPLLARVSVGCVFITSGWGKIQHIDKVVGFFTSLGIPAPVFQAHLVAYTEFTGGLLLIAGLATRIYSVALGIIMIVALKTALAPDIGGFSDLVGVMEYLCLLLLIWLAVAGPGKISLDALVAKRFRNRS
jgi:putative oxidoreductase